MKVAAPFTLRQDWRDIPDEYNIIYGETSSEQKVLDFCEQYPNKRINISFKADVNIEWQMLQKIQKQYPNLVFKANSSEDGHYASELNIPFFFGKNLGIDNMNDVEAVARLGVTDIYPVDDLFYHLDDVHTFCKKHNIQVRMVLNRIPVTNNSDISTTSPFYSPRDVAELSQYIDVFEFDCGYPYDWHKFNVYYKTYVIKQDWLGQLWDLNPDMTLSYIVPCFEPGANKRKMTCGRKCEKGHKCKHCYIIQELSNTLLEEELYINKDLL